MSKLMVNEVVDDKEVKLMEGFEIDFENLLLDYALLKRASSRYRKAIEYFKKETALELRENS